MVTALLIIIALIFLTPLFRKANKPLHGKSKIIALIVVPIPTLVLVIMAFHFSGYGG